MKRPVHERREGTRYPGSNAKFDTGLQEAETIERLLSPRREMEVWKCIPASEWHVCYCRETGVRASGVARAGKRVQGGGDAWKMIARALVHWKISVEAKRETLTWLVMDVNGAGKSNSMRISSMNNDEAGRWMILLCSRSFYGIFVSLGCSLW